VAGLIFTLFLAHASADLISYKMGTVSSKTISLKKACETLLGQTSPLAEKKDMNRVDCMGREFMVKKYCAQKFAANMELTRGFINKEGK
jgi:hypothetical protein